jgi:hypothetical protein
MSDECAAALKRLKPLQGMEISADGEVVSIRHHAPIAVFDPLETLARQHQYRVTRRGCDLEAWSQYYVRLEMRRVP